MGKLRAKVFGLPTSDDDFLKKATVIDAVKRKMKLQIESEVAKV